MQEDFIILVAASPIGSTANKIWNKLQQKKAHWKEQVRAQCGLRSAGSQATIPLEQQAQHQHSFEKDSVSQSSRSTFNHVQFFSQLAMLIVANVRRQCWILSGLRRVLLLRHQKPIRPVGKFFVAKTLISFTSYTFRSCCYHYYCRYQWRSNCTTYEEESKDWTQEDAAKSLQDYLIFIEMSLAAVFSVSQSGRSAFNRAREPENDATIQLCTDNNRRQSQY